MVLDFATYMCIMGFFAGFVLLNDENTFDWAEIVFASYVWVSAPFDVSFAFLRVRQLIRVCLGDALPLVGAIRVFISFRLYRLSLNTRMLSRGAFIKANDISTQARQFTMLSNNLDDLFVYIELIDS